MRIKSGTVWQFLASHEQSSQVESIQIETISWQFDNWDWVNNYLMTIWQYTTQDAVTFARYDKTNCHCEITLLFISLLLCPCSSQTKHVYQDKCQFKENYFSCLSWVSQPQKMRKTKWLPMLKRHLLLFSSRPPPGTLSAWLHWQKFPIFQLLILGTNFSAKPI